MSKDAIDALGHLFYLAIFIGMAMLARGNVYGWASRFLGELGWLGLGVAMGLTSVWGWGIIFVIMDVYGYCRWSKREKQALTKMQMMNAALELIADQTVDRRVRDIAKASLEEVS